MKKPPESGGQKHNLYYVIQRKVPLVGIIGFVWDKRKKEQALNCN